MTRTPFKLTWVVMTALSILLPSCKAKAPARQEPAPKPQPAPKPEPAQKSQEASAGEKHVQVSVHPLDTDQNGRWDLLAFEWKITPGWHIYWTNPGDSGLATKVKFTGASQGAFGAVQLPAPERFESPGGIVGYGYSDHTAFFASRTQPDTPISKLSAKLSWLVCKDSCLRGSKTLELSLPKSAAPFSAPLKQAFDRIPSPASELPATLRWKGQGDVARALQVQPNSGEMLEFFPLETQVGPSGIELRKDLLSITYPQTSVTPHDSSPQGVVGLKEQGKTRYYLLAAPWPSP